MDDSIRSNNDGRNSNQSAVEVNNYLYVNRHLCRYPESCAFTTHRCIAKTLTSRILGLNYLEFVIYHNRTTDKILKSGFVNIFIKYAHLDDCERIILKVAYNRYLNNVRVEEDALRRVNLIPPKVLGKLEPITNQELEKIVLMLAMDIPETFYTEKRKEEIKKKIKARILIDTPISD